MVDVTHVSPLALGDDGVWGGGERYPLELARAMSRHVRTRLLTFGRRRATFRDGALEVRMLASRGRFGGGDINPLSERLPFEIAGSRIVHAHQYKSVVTNACILVGRALRRPVFCTDHGGSARNFAARLGLERHVAEFLAVSRFSAGTLPELRDRVRVIYGGVDVERFHPDETPRQRQVVYVGRVLPHKGVDVLVRAIDPDVPLLVFGREVDATYLDHLRRLAAGKRVAFHHDASDADIVQAYRRSKVAVLPSVEWTHDGGRVNNGELLGLALLEAMACGTPAIGSDTGGISEILAEGRGGALVPPGDAGALAEQIRGLLADPAHWARTSSEAVGLVRERFTWEHVAERCLDAYAARRSAPGDGGSET